MTFSWGVALFIFFGQFLGYAVKGLVGFGNPLVSSPILSMRLDNTTITPGTLLLRFSMPWVIKTLLGIVVLFIGIEMATRGLQPKRERRKLPALDLTVAFFSGICAGLFGINMILVGYLQRTAKDYNEFKGSICFLFLGDNLFRLCSYAINGLMTRDALFFGACSVPAALLAMLLAGWVAPRLDEAKLQKGAIALFILGGISIIVKSVIFHT